MVETRHTFCRICEALCGLEVDVEGDRVVAIRPDPRHVATEGFACIKGLKQHRMYGSPDRLKYPLRRVGNRFERVSWDHALSEIGASVRRLTREHHPDAVAMYVGTAAGFGVLHPIFAQGFMTALGSRSMYSSATQDCANKFAASQHIYGFPFTLSFPDVDRNQCLIVVGANPVVSKWSFLQVSNPARRLKAIEARGGKVYFVDPRRTESAKTAGEHVFIRPNTDVFFFLSFLHVLIESGGVDRQRVASFMSGFATLERIAAAWPPERTERVTRIPAGKLREMVDVYLRSGRSALYCSTGVNMGTNGTLAFWIQEAINAVSGNLDRLGGTLVGRGIFDFARFCQKQGMFSRPKTSRIGGFAAVNDGFPGGILADEILTPGERQVRALFVTGGNPLLTMANSERLRAAFEELELLVVTDITLNETASLAHYVLPATSPLERPDLPFAFPLLLGLQSRPYLQATREVLPPAGEQRDEATIYLELCKASGANLFGSRIAQRALEALKLVNSVRQRERQPQLPQEWLLSAILRATGHGSFDRLLAERHGKLRPDHLENDFLGRRVPTDDGLVHLAPAPLVEQAQKLERDFGAELESAGSLKLITKRAQSSHNSWTHNLEDFVRKDRGTNHLYMHPSDAAERSLGEGDLADVSSATATVRVPVRLLSELMPGTVALPHGWGHQRARGLSVASKTSGVNANLLAADGPDRLEHVSGMAQLTGIVVDVVPARAARDTASWSGIPPPPESDAARRAE
jgi:anaerobic selenocysteine-containing dehydrogenase